MVTACQDSLGYIGDLRNAIVCLIPSPTPNVPRHLSALARFGLSTPHPRLKALPLAASWAKVIFGQGFPLTMR